MRVDDAAALQLRGESGGEAAVALSISRLAAVRRCRSAASTTRRTLSAEQPDTSELMIETAPLLTAETTPPFCGCEERAG